MLVLGYEALMNRNTASPVDALDDAIRQLLQAVKPIDKHRQLMGLVVEAWQSLDPGERRLLNESQPRLVVALLDLEDAVSG